MNSSLNFRSRAEFLPLKTCLLHRGNSPNPSLAKGGFLPPETMPTRGLSRPPRGPARPPRGCARGCARPRAGGARLRRPPGFGWGVWREGERERESVRGSSSRVRFWEERFLFFFFINREERSSPLKSHVREGIICIKTPKILVITKRHSSLVLPLGQG